MNNILEKLISAEHYQILASLNFVVISISLFLFATVKSNLERIFIMSILSSFVALLYLLLDAPDVAMTEASIGACLSTVILLLFLQKIKTLSSSQLVIKFSIIRHLSAIISCAIILIIFYELADILPKFGNSGSQVEIGVSDYYIKYSKSEIGIPAFVAAILASYRGFDTLGETFVILVAGLAVSIIFSMKYEKK